MSDETERIEELNELLRDVRIGAKPLSCHHAETNEAPSYDCCDWGDIVNRIDAYLWGKPFGVLRKHLDSANAYAETLLATNATLRAERDAAQAQLRIRDAIIQRARAVNDAMHHEHTDPVIRHQFIEPMFEALHSPVQPSDGAALSQPEPPVLARLRALETSAELLIDSVMPLMDVRLCRSYDPVLVQEAIDRLRDALAARDGGV